MPTTRSSQGSSQSSPSTSASKKNTNNRKRSAESSSSPAAKRGKTAKSEVTPKKGKPGQQKTIEETLKDGEGDIEEDDDVEMQINDGEGNKDVNSNEQESKDTGKGDKVTELEAREEAVKKREDVLNSKNGQDEQATAEQKDSQDTKSHDDGVKDGEKNAFDEIKADTGEVKEAAKQEQEEKSAEINENNESVVQDDKREAMVPSSILEKGIIYFFFRGRVGVDDPQGIEDVARSYIVLRPLPIGAKIGEGPLADTGDARMLALPKKMLPKSKRDRFLVFVEKSKASVKELRDQFAENNYSTKTSGTSHTPAATPFAEGIYAITSTGRESHLAYHITVPSPIGDVQNELGLYERGSFVVSVKNPDAPGPANASLSNPAQYPEHIQKKFRGLRWMPLEPELLNYDNTQFLIIGEGLGDVDKAAEEVSKDQKDDAKEKPAEELEKLEEEDHYRVENLKEDDPVFADLGLSSKEYPKMQTTW